ncbi:nitrate reductase [Roseibium sp. RKSG952]|uniref:nitrate reductase n=1 Tax=Roseibium sp. RKSG952 TaxID=2529384 RepID=UPI0012BCBAC6|nr:nitrate reductase [Roseibium sp. RKSG952]MTH95814.1 nitrate reductase [Roseibium sp. RKSG952]
MTKFINPLAPKMNRLTAKSSEIKGWVRELMDLSADTPLTIAELACRDAGCPDIETVIGVLEPGKPIVTIRVHGTMSDVTRADIENAANLGK